MKEKLPVYLENHSLPEKEEDEMTNHSYGYVSILYILSIIITLGSIFTLMFIGK